LTGALAETGVVLSESLYRERFSSAPLSGAATILIQGRRYPVVGIAGAAVGVLPRVDVWLPHALDNSNRGDRRLTVWARLRPSTTPAAFGDALDALQQQLAAQYPDDNGGWRAKATPAVEAIVGTTIPQQLRLVAYAVILLLLLATVNLGNLMIARGLRHGRDWATRRALGGSDAQLLAIPVAEAAWLATVGGLAGVALGLAGLRIAATAWSALPRALEPDPMVTLLAVLIGSSPVWLGSVAAALVARGRHSLQRAQRTQNARRILVLAQFGLATVLLIGASALMQQWRELLKTDPGFDPHVLSARFSIDDVVDEASYSAGLQTTRALAAAIREVPGVLDVAVASEVPMGAIDTEMSLGPGDVPPREQDAKQASWRIVSSGYLGTIGTRLIDGRDFRDDENSDSVLISAALAQQLWPDQIAVGRRMTFENGRTHQVVGVVADVRQRELAAPPKHSVYLPTSWYLWPTMTLLIRAEGDPAQRREAIVAAARQARPDAPLFDIALMSARVADHLSGRRQQLYLMQLFGIASLLLSALGIASVIAASIAQRRSELALRAALGATLAQLRGREVLHGGALALGGTLLGLTALALLQPWSSALWRFDTIQPVAAAVAIGLSLASAILASWYAARSVNIAQPMALLRSC
jgi:predicted permease